MALAQETFDFTFRSAMGGRDFIVSSSNEAAIKWLDRWREWPMPFLAVSGEKGCGKTHLCHVWAEMTQAEALTGKGQFERGLPDSIRENGFYYIDAIETWLGTPAEESLFHLFNYLKQGGGRCVMTAHKAPGQWDIALKDLASRLRSCPSVHIEPPDDALLQALLVKTFRDRQILIKQEVIQYLVPRMERRFDAIPKLVDKIDKAALQAKKPVTVPLVRNVLNAG